MFSDPEKLDLTGLKVLVAESNRMNLIIIYELLTSLGCDVIVTHKSIEAVEKNLIYTPDIILISVEMSDNRYADAIRIIRRNERSEKAVPVIGLVSASASGKKKEIMNDGPDDFLKNPFTREDFYMIVQKHVSNRITSSDPEKNQTETSLSIFNFRAFEDHFQSDRDLMKKNLETFMKDLPRLIMKLKVAVATRYYPEIEHFAHSIKGMASEVFAEKLKTVAYHIEIIGQARDNSKIIECSVLIEKLEKNFREVKKEMETLL